MDQLVSGGKTLFAHTSGIDDKLSIALALTATAPAKACRTPTAVHCAGSS